LAGYFGASGDLEPTNGTANHRACMADTG
jgi:hypothetical protein